MVASLQCKKEALEAKLRDKTNELKKLCFEEAELTGILPVETPLEPGESPPHFPRRIGTSFAFPENLIDKLQSKEDKAIASLELELQIQIGIAEAALGIANDGSSSRSVRRRHKVIYQDSQRKLFDLESKLKTLKNLQSRQLKKNNSSPSDGIPATAEDEKTSRNASPSKHETLSHSLSDSLVPTRQYHSFNSLSRASSQYYSAPLGNHYKPGYSAGGNYMNCALPSIPQQCMVVPDQSHPDSKWYLDNERNSMTNQFYSTDTYDTISHRNRTGVVERNDNYQSFNESYSRMASTLPRNGCNPPTSSVLLPGQTYPDNSLMRTQSLGNVGNYSQPEKKKEKQWYETSLDSSPVQSRSHQVSGQVSPIDVVKTPEPVYDQSSDRSYTSSPAKTQHASINSFQFDRVVPYESPKNHTVIEAGKWQPYREVTKPFEMSDFYKYSTKFRKGKTSPASNSIHRNDVGVQQKAIYQPLQPQECQPLTNEIDKNVATPSELPKSLPSSPEPVSAWYGEKQPGNSGTLV